MLPYPLLNLSKFFTTCFAHYFAALLLALAWFFLISNKKNAILNVFVCGFLCTLAFHTVIKSYSSRYMLIPVLLSLPIIACAAVVLKDNCTRRFRLGLWIFTLLVITFTLFSFLKFNRARHHHRDEVLMRTAKIIKEDFDFSDTDEAVLISNGDNAGIILLLSGIDGKFCKFSFEQQATQQKLRANMELLCSQHPLVYIIKDDTTNKKPKQNGILNYDFILPHSYKTCLIGTVQGKRGKYELLRIKSQYMVTRDRMRITEFISAPAKLLDNGNFSQWRECLLSTQSHANNRLLTEHPQQLLPKMWVMDFNNRRGGDFSDWTLTYNPLGAKDGNSTICFHAPDGGFALQGQQKLPAMDCRLKVAVKLTSGSKLLAFLYVYRKNGSLLSTQPVGVYRCTKSEEILLSFPICRNSLPEGGVLFSVGLIGWQGDFSLNKIDLMNTPSETLK